VQCVSLGQVDAAVAALRIRSGYSLSIWTPAVVFIYRAHWRGERRFGAAIAAKQRNQISSIRQAEELTAEIDIATNERQRLETLLPTLEQLQHSDMHEFSVVQSVGSDRERIMPTLRCGTIVKDRR
jgi:hypothetical protein